MFQVSPEDVLRGLKRFKRLAKQDILASAKTPNPEFWTRQAESRRQTYDLLMDSIEHHGLEATYDLARTRFKALPAVDSSDAEARGERQAYELFFSVLGVDHEGQPFELGAAPAVSDDSSLAVNAHS